ncbi:unnamed protein product [Pleuronectes platessa]|uniref:Uncharacterized protein n=1 Tax=Pleuronectes platessa TaxID=8262 RepID=A0A9N7ZBT1_PLEPL|nr:unnamed protein product [Pleuronectes platessa]
MIAFQELQAICVSLYPVNDRKGNLFAATKTSSFPASFMLHCKEEAVWEKRQEVPPACVLAPSRSLELGSRVILARCPDRSVKKEEEMFLYLECGHFISRIYSRGLWNIQEGSAMAMILALFSSIPLDNTSQQR